jgi:hypothetical protein
MIQNIKTAAKIRGMYQNLKDDTEEWVKLEWLNNRMKNMVLNDELSESDFDRGIIWGINQVASMLIEEMTK